jgi:hypothetical protein
MSKTIRRTHCVSAVMAIGIMGFADAAAAADCPGFDGSWAFGGLDISQADKPVSDLLAASTCQLTITDFGAHQKVSGDCTVSDAQGVAYVIAYTGPEGTVEFKKRPVRAGEHLPFDVSPEDGLAQVAAKVKTGGGQGLGYGRTGQPNPVSVTLLCLRKERPFLFQFGFDQQGRMVDVEENAIYAGGRGLYVDDVTFHTTQVDP